MLEVAALTGARTFPARPVNTQTSRKRKNKVRENGLRYLMKKLKVK
jgi:hypothetical protein